MDSAIYDGYGIIDSDKLENVEMNHSDTYICMSIQEYLLKGIIKMSDIKDFCSKKIIK